jgi:hypothetical protein
VFLGWLLTCVKVTLASGRMNLIISEKGTLSPPGWQSYHCLYREDTGYTNNGIY